jgi:redox-sensing transcriptional repressor
MNLSEKVINRLTLYHSILLGWRAENITSAQIAALLRIDASQVRKDIKMLDNVGVCKVGYPAAALKKSIEDTLGVGKAKEAFIVGAGNLGTALAKYDNFAPYGLNVLALFDNDPLKAGRIINGKEVFDISKLPDLTRRLNVRIAILTVPREFAQNVADLLAASGIKYIWNFSPSILQVPDDVEVWNENLVGNFLQFTINHKD